VKLLIVSHVPHYVEGDECWAYGPYAKEIEIWADLFSQVIIAAPCGKGAPPQDAHRIARSNVRVAPQKEIGISNWREACYTVLVLPILLLSLSRQMRKADAIHVRCPGNVGLVGVLLAPLFSRFLIAKYAGQWNGFPGEKWTVRLQRAILRSRWWKGPVTVYGDVSRQPAHVVSFFTSMLNSAQLSRARGNLAARGIPATLTVAYSGRLTKSKNVDVLLRAAAALKAEDLPVKVLVIGEGPEFSSLQSLTKELGIQEEVEFTGGVHPERVPQFLERADVFVLASDTEGWPKALAEAMAFGLICIGSDRGMIPSFLAGGRGFTVQPRDIGALADALRKIVSAPAAYQEMRESASQWASQYSLEQVRDALRDLMVQRWKLAGLRRVGLEAVREVQSR